MKRSRDSRYDKKRSRDRKDDKRKFTFSVKKDEKSRTNERVRKSNSHEHPKRNLDKRKATHISKNSTSTSQGNFSQASTPKEFEVFSKSDKTYQQRTTHRRKKSGFPKIVLPLGVMIVLFLIRFLLNIGSTSTDSLEDDTITTYEPVYQRNDRVIPVPTKKRQRIQEANFFVGEENPLREVTQLTEDSIINILPNVEVRLFKGFHIYEPKENPKLPIVASYSKYHFFYNEVEADKTQSLSEQWSILRETLAESMYNGYFIYQYPKAYTVDDMKINETEFSISTDDHTVYGVATLIEHKEKRHFFQFISKEKESKAPNYAYLRKYLNYYVKINGEVFQDEDL